MTTQRYSDNIFPGATHVGANPYSPAVLPKPPAWMNNAACAGAWTGFDIQDSGNITKANRYAMRICETCPVRAACTAYADENRLQGIWGGVPRTRQTYSKPRPDRPRLIDRIIAALDADPTHTTGTIAELLGTTRDAVSTTVRTYNRRDLAETMRDNYKRQAVA